MMVGAGDERIKAIATIDPWLGPCSDEIGYDKFRMPDPNQALCIIETQSFADEVYEIQDSNQRNDLDKFVDASSNGQLTERILLDKISSIY